MSEATDAAHTAAPSGIAQVHNVYDLMRVVLTHPSMSVDEKQKLIDELRKSTVSDRWTFRWAIWILGLVVLLTVGALWHLTMFSEYPVPDGLVAIGSAAAGGLAGLLTPTRGNAAETA